MTAVGGESTPSLVSGDVRRHNLALVLETIVRGGPSARSEIADSTGLTRGSVTALTAALTDAGVLRESEPLVGGRGRPLTRLELAADGVALAVLQIDADTATVLVSSVAGDELFRHVVHHGRPMGDADAVLDVAADVLARGLAGAEAAGRRVADLSVVVFAPVGGDPARVIADTDLGWGEVDVVAALRTRVAHLPADIRLEADVNVAALAELSLLSGIRNAVYIKSNSGIGGAVIVDGRVAAGRAGVGGALGHLPLVPGGALCECGQTGCLVTVAGPDVVLTAAGLGERLGTDGLTAALDEFVARISAGDAAACSAWDGAVDWIGRALQVLTMTLDPDVVIIGGYWAALTPSIDRALHANRPLVVGSPFYPDTPVLAGRLGNDVALLGALWAARDRVLADPLRSCV